MSTGFTRRALCALALVTLSPVWDGATADVLTPVDVFDIRRAAEARISPDGKWIAYTVASMRDPAAITDQGIRTVAPSVRPLSIAL